MKSRQMKRWRYLRATFFVLAIGLALGVSAIAAAQTAPYYQFGCWGVMSTGGGYTQIAQPDGSHLLYGSMGIWSGGVSENTDYTISSGHLGPFAYGADEMDDAVIETDTDTSPTLYLPFVGNFVEGCVRMSLLGREGRTRQSVWLQRKQTGNQPYSIKRQDTRAALAGRHCSVNCELTCGWSVNLNARLHSNHSTGWRVDGLQLWKARFCSEAWVCDNTSVSVHFEDSTVHAVCSEQATNS